MTSKTIPGQCEDPGCSYRGPATTTWTGETHAETCSRVKMKVVASHPFGTCASGEARPTQGKNNEKINYQFGTWGGSGVGGVDSNNGSCYRAGQKRDNDKTDLTVAYLCGAN